MPGPRFLLSGYYGFGNLGDEALLGVIATQLRRRFPGCAIDVLSADPAATAAEYAVEATPRADPGALREAIARADVVLSGGGGLLQNATSTRSLLYYCEIVRRAVRAKKIVLLFAQSVGPLDLWGRAIVRWWCAGVAAATLRDQRSCALVKGLLPGVPVEQTADPVFLIEPAGAPFDLAAQGLDPDGGYAIVSVRRAPGFEGIVNGLAAAVDRLAEKHGAQVAFLPLGGPSDAEASTEVIRRCRTAPTLLPACGVQAALQIIARAHAVIGMRLHALIFAARSGVPFLAIPYDPKVRSLLDDLAYPLPPLFTLGTAQEGRAVRATVHELIDRLWEEREAVAARMAAGLAGQQELAARNFDVLERVVSRLAVA